jgi:hypothetical protein
MKKADIKKGQKYVVKGTKTQTDSRYGGYSYPQMVGVTMPGANMRYTQEYGQVRQVLAGVAAAHDIRGNALSDDAGLVELLSRATVEVLELDERIPFTSKDGVKVKMALQHPKYQKVKADEWVEKVIPYTDFVQTFADWRADVDTVLGELQPKLKEVTKAIQAAIKAEEEARKAELAKRTKAEQARAKQLAAREATETKLRTILQNYGINDSDGWRGVNTKDRYSTETNSRVLTTYVRHLDINDVLTLTGGRTEPPAKTNARKAKKA